ncbi:MAG: hypothetical protein H6607_06435 [Flavobacteriales bacterium]|nr:hypothetical protein [Flavobacteriales bacterium]
MFKYKTHTGIIILSGILFGFCMAFVSCSSSDPDVANPYNNQTVDTEDEIVNGNNVAIDPNSIQGLHKNIFKPTCANSGCHDGNFEPDFRTIQSSYNTLVNQPIIKNDAINPLTARVVPGSAANSMLIKRLLIDLNGNSGIMPLVTEPNSDWKYKKEEYIKNIENWIDNGALDQNGKQPTTSNFPVQLKGIAAKINGNLAGRLGTYDPISVPPGTSQIELWFAFEDESLSADQLSGASLDLSISANDFDGSNSQNLTYSATPLTAPGYFGDDEKYYHKATISLSNWKSGDVVWIRTQISDGVNNSELPNDNSLFRAKQYATFKLK